LIKSDNISNKNFCSPKCFIEGVQKATDIEDVFSIHVTNKEFLPRVYIGSLKINKKKINKTLEKWTRILIVSY
jgi:hypothetical protein